MGSVDLKDAYYSIPIHPKHKKFLKFTWKEQVYQYTCLPNGYSDAMRIFTKLLKPAFGHLRMLGFLSVSYVDDSYLQGEDCASCADNISATTNVCMSLGYTIHVKKSILDPTQEMEFLGFILNSKEMSITITLKKKVKIIALCEQVLNTHTPSIRLVAKLIGNLVATEEAFPIAPLHFKPIEIDKAEAVQMNNGNYDAHMMLNDTSIHEIKWWINNIMDLKYWIHCPPVDKVIYTDASKQGWGAESDGVTANGRWTDQDVTPLNINYLEILAAKFAILSFCKATKPRHIRIMTDNVTTESYINHQGGSVSERCHEVSRDIWYWAEKHQVWISAAYIPGTSNIDADEQSREFNDATEWSIDDHIFNSIIQTWGTPDIDLFATRINHKLPLYVSWKPDPGSYAIDAFSITWDQQLIYCFPPFSILWRTLDKISREEAEAILVMPLWPTQSWFPFAMSMLVDHPLVFQARHLHLPNKPQASHPLVNTLTLVVLRLSGKPYNNSEFVQQHKKSSWHHGGKTPKNGMHLHLKNGTHFVSRTTLIPFTLI